MNDNEIITRRVLLSTQNDVKNFCHTMENFPRNVSIKVIHNNHERDAKSILGLLSLNLSEPVDVIFSSKNLIDTVKIDNVISKWEV